MADRFISVVQGEGLPFQVTEGAASSGEGFELRLSDAYYSLSRVQRDHMIRALQNYLRHVETVPAA